jgi:CubicO group peptidase (beta-lactamase class C family)
MAPENMDKLNGVQNARKKVDLNMGQVDVLMRQAVSANVFPGAVLLVSRQNSIFFQHAYGFADLFTRRLMTLETFFDLASMTKPLATALAVMLLVQRGQIGLEQKLGDILPKFSQDQKSAIKVKHLLYHNSGLADYRSYYKKVERLAFGTRKTALRELLAMEALINPIGAKVLYSDIGFMILEWLVEHVSGQRLDHFTAEMIYGPLGIDNLFFVDLNAKKPQGVFAATEQCPWRRTLLDGQVHDENAYVVGGVQGHAGLFGTAAAVHTLLTELMSVYHGNGSGLLFQTDLVRRFLTRLPDSDKALGFDATTEKHSSAGRFFSSNSVGHLGFTGTSFWMDLDRWVIVILLSNRVHPTRQNMDIKAFRPKLHDTVMLNLIGL